MSPKTDESKNSDFNSEKIQDSQEKERQAKQSDQSDLKSKSKSTFNNDYARKKADFLSEVEKINSKMANFLINPLNKNKQKPSQVEKSSNGDKNGSINKSGSGKKDRDKKGNDKSRKNATYFMGSPKMNAFLNLVFVALLIYAGYNYLTDTPANQYTVSLTELATLVDSGLITGLEIDGSSIIASTGGKVEYITRKETDSSVTETLLNYGVSTDSLRAITIEIKAPSTVGTWLGYLIPILLPIIIIVLIILYLSRQMKGGSGMQPFNFGQSKARMIDPKDPRKKVTFADVAGVHEAKEELKEIVQFLKHPKKFLNIGAQIPKGVLLMGAPGTGKTLLARAVAGEAGVPFFSISGSEFVEMFVGVGASRVRDLFKMAKKVAPAIVFIDEIDAVGRSRGIGTGGGNDEREQTLNQILVEMDGFEPSQTVIVMAATNRPDVLDPALLRPGRFDRRITVDSPDRKGRVEILKIQARNKPLAEDVNFEEIAERTPGFTGADIYSLVNEAAIWAARKDKKVIQQSDFIAAIEKVMLGPERRSHLLSDHEKKVTAYHEAGHAVVSAALEHTDPVHKITIVSRGRALGYVLSLPREDVKLRTRKQFLDMMAMSLGGYVTEQLIFDDLSTGPSNDLEKVTERARAMVTRYGMSEDIGPIALETETGSPLYGVRNRQEYSEEVAKAIDFEVSRLVNEAKERATEIVKTHRTMLEEIANTLIKQETIERQEFAEIVKKYGLKPKQETPENPGVTIAE